MFPPESAEGKPWGVRAWACRRFGGKHKLKLEVQFFNTDIHTMNYILTIFSDYEVTVFCFCYDNLFSVKK